jgi:hypothetical protein
LITRELTTQNEKESFTPLRVLNSRVRKWITGRFGSLSGDESFETWSIGKASPREFEDRLARLMDKVAVCVFLPELRIERTCIE